MKIKNNKINHSSLLLAILIGLVLVNGCVSPPGPKVFIVKHFQEDASLSDTALVMTTLVVQSGAIMVRTISEGLGMDGGDIVQHRYVLLKPGRYTFDIDSSLTHSPEIKVVGGEVLYSFGKSEYIGISVTKTVEVKAGHVYYLDGFINKDRKNWQATIKEIASDNIAESGSRRLINSYEYVRNNYMDPSISRLGVK